MGVIGLVLSCFGLTIVADAIYQHEFSKLVCAMRGDFNTSFHHHALGIPLLAVWTAWLVIEAVRKAR